MDSQNILEMDGVISANSLNSFLKAADSKFILESLKQILYFLRNDVHDMCFVNVDETLFLFYKMIINGTEFSRSSFLDDECKIVVNEIKQTVASHRYDFTCIVSSGENFKATPVIFSKVYVNEVGLREKSPETPVCIKHMEGWIETTLQFIKSSQPMLTYPEMPTHEALYLYRGILGMDSSQAMSDNRWISIWEALRIFRLRYVYIVFLLTTDTEDMMFVNFEKFPLRKNKCVKKKNKSSDNINDVYGTLSKSENEKMLSNSVHTKVHEKPEINSANNEFEFPHDKATLLNNLSKSENSTDIKSFDENNPEPAEILIKVPSKIAIDNDTDLNLLDTLPLFVESKAIINMNCQKGATFHCGNCKDLNDEMSSGNKGTQHIDAELEEQETLNESANLDKLSDIVAGDDNDTKTLNEEKISLLSQPIQHSIKENLTLQSENESYIRDINTTDIKEEKTEINIPDELKSFTTDEINFPTGNPFMAAIEKNKSLMNVANELENLIVGIDVTTKNPSVQQNTNHVIIRQSFINEKDFIATDCSGDNPNRIANNDVINDIRKLINPNYQNNDEPNVFKEQSEMVTKSVSKAEIRAQKKILLKSKLVALVSEKFLLTSLQAILDFIADQSRATLEFVGLNVYEFRFLKKFKKFSSFLGSFDVIFHGSSCSLAVTLFKSLNNIADFSLNIQLVLGRKVKKQRGVIPTQSNAETRERSVTFTKIPFKDNEKTKPNAATEAKKSKADDGAAESGKPKSAIGKIIDSGHRVKPPDNWRAKRAERPLDSGEGPASDKIKGLASVRSGRDDGSAKLTMTTKLIEGLSVPLESDKAMRMMRLMGWKGGALGVRGEGLTEPLVPRFDVPKGAGLGHGRYQTNKKNMDKLQKEIMHQRNIRKIAESPNKETGVSNFSDECKEVAMKPETEAKGHKNVGWLTNETLTKRIKKKLNPTHTADEDNDERDQWIAKSLEASKDLGSWATNSSVDKKKKKKIASIKAANNAKYAIKEEIEESLLFLKQSGFGRAKTTNRVVKSDIAEIKKDKVKKEKIKEHDGETNSSDNEKSRYNNSTNDILAEATNSKVYSDYIWKNEVIDTVDEQTAKSNKDENSNETDEIDNNGNLSYESIIQKNIRVVRYNHERLMMNLEKMKNIGVRKSKLTDMCIRSEDATDESVPGSDPMDRLHPYDREFQRRFLSQRSQFLVNLLHLLQEEKSHVVVAYNSKPNKTCVKFIQYVVSCLNRRSNPDHPPGRERALLDACAAEMSAHDHLELAFEWNVNALVLLKLTAGRDVDAMTSRAISDVTSPPMPTTHEAVEHRYAIPSRCQGVERQKVLVNRLLLEFIRCRDGERVYSVGRMSPDVRGYVSSLASLLNRGATLYQLGLGGTEHVALRDMMEAVKDLCLIVRLDPRDGYFNKLQFIKVYLTKRCLTCQRMNDPIVPFKKTQEIIAENNTDDDDSVDIDDVDIYPNRFDDSDDLSDKSGKEAPVDDKSDFKVPNKVISATANDEESDVIESGEEYLFGENWLDTS